MRARFIKSSETHLDLGIEFVPETKDEELLIDLFTRYSESTNFELKFYGWDHGGGGRYEDGRERFTRAVRGMISKKPEEP